jgi:Flp pilus assembly protein TadD
MQQALVLEEAGAVREALRHAVDATRLEPTNWQPWLVRARLESRAGDADQALASFRTARRLNPLSELFEP